MTKNYFDAISDTALLAYINRLESENEELRLATEGKAQNIDTLPEISTIDEIEQIKKLSVMEAGLVNMAFGVSEELGITALMNSTQSFEAFLRGRDKMFIRGMSIEYRIFIVDLILLIDEQYRDVATSKILLG